MYSPHRHSLTRYFLNILEHEIYKYSNDVKVQRRASYDCDAHRLVPLIIPIGLHSQLIPHTLIFPKP
jgi:hypothetical protein